jgi:hypothetical protein
VFPEVTEAFESLLLMEELMEEEISETVMSVLEGCVVLLYDRTGDLVQVNNARKQLFAQKSRSLESILSIYAALRKKAHCHVLQALFLPLPPNAEMVSHPVKA